jgi:SAM-dependent methyltransferase
MNYIKLTARLEKVNCLKVLGKLLISPSTYIFPKSILLHADPERAMVDRFIQNIRVARTGEMLLDAGAGNLRFKELLIAKHFEYASQDFEQVSDQTFRGSHNYVCDIKSIPVESNTFGVIVCTQVLEHLPDPLGSLKELARILKPGGELYLTTNFLFPIHGAPHDFFRYTNYGLDHLLKECGFSQIQISARGGFFSLCAKIIFDLPEILSSWLFFGGANPHSPRELRVKSWALVVIFTPLIFLLDLFSKVFAFLVSRFDWLDRKKRFTLGYQLKATRS